ncbi:MAG: dynamin family protein [Akkermansia sp.]
MNSLLNEEIVENRKKVAPELKSLRDKATQIVSYLTSLKSSTLAFPRPIQLDPILVSLESLIKRVDNKLKLFENGTITVSIAGVEKSGKTTMLQYLTGIKNLPTDERRCTSVPCEILYTSDNEHIEVSYYTDAELLSTVINPLWKYLQTAPQDESGSFLLPNIPLDLDSFIHSNLPNIDALPSMTRQSFGDTLERLKVIIPQGLNQDRALLGTTVSDSLENLSQYASHVGVTSKSVARMALVKKVKIYKKFEGGSDFLRLCDTPGVDDPNPSARSHTFRTIEEETDLLVIANRPGNMPDITEVLANFLSDLSNRDKDSPLRQRSIFFVNWHQAVDPAQELAKYRIQEVQKYEVFDQDSIYGPCDVTDESSMMEFMRYVNQRLSRDLPRQDRGTINKLTDDFNNIKASIRLNICNVLESQAPPLPDQMREILNEEFDVWFEGSAVEKDPEQHFKGRLKFRLNKLTKDIQSNVGIQKIIQEVNDKYEEYKKRIASDVSENCSVEQCQKLLNTEEDPIAFLMPYLGERFTEIVKELTKVIEDISPLVQKDILRVIHESIKDDDAFNELCSGIEPKFSDGDKLEQLAKRLKNGKPQDDDVQFIIDAISEYTEFSSQMRHIMRYELRPALNIWDKFRWQSNRRDHLLDTLIAVIKQDKETNSSAFLNPFNTLNVSSMRSKVSTSWLNEYRTKDGDQHFPGKGDPAEVHTKFIKNLADISIEIIGIILSVNSNQIKDLAEDFMAQASQTLGTHLQAMPGWKKALKAQSHIILRGKNKELMQKSQESEQFYSLTKNIKEALN